MLFIPHEEISTIVPNSNFMEKIKSFSTSPESKNSKAQGYQSDLDNGSFLATRSSDEESNDSNIRMSTRSTIEFTTMLKQKISEYETDQNDQEQASH